MTNQRELDLLVDVARLLRKYGPDTFARLARYLREPQAMDNLASVLESYARTARRRLPSAGRKNRSASKQREQFGRDALLALAKDDAEKSELLVLFWDDLQAGRRLPRLKDLREFALDYDLPQAPASSRGRAISSLTKHLMTLPLERVKAILHAAPPSTSSRGASLEAWTNVILNKDTDPKASE